MPKASIVIPTYNHFHDCLKPCLESLIANTDLSSVEVIVVANGCSDETAEYVRSLGSSFVLLEYKEAIGYTRAANEGIKRATGEFVVLLNNDCQLFAFTPNQTWLDILLEPFSDPTVGVTGPLKHTHKPTNTAFVLFFCSAFRRELIKATGLLDEVFNPGYGEDIDFCRKVAGLGYQVYQVPDNSDLTNHAFPLWHQESKTVHEVPGWEDIVRRNERVLAERYSSVAKRPKYSIVIPTYNHLDDYLKPCLESIRQNTDLSVTEVVVVANGCVDGTVEYVRSLGAGFRLIEHKEPLGYTKATNIGMAAAQGDYIVLLGNDCVLQGKDWLDILERPFSESNVGMTGPLLQTHPETQIEFLVFFCAMLKRDVIQKCGFLDEIYSPGYGEDIDYCRKMAINGFKLVQVPKEGTEQLFPIYHMAGGTVRYLPDWNKIVERNTDLLISRFGKKFKVYDCFMYFDESDMLELRLNVLDDVVDVFVITESQHTFSGIPKPRYLEDVLKQARFAKFLPKIVHLVSNEPPVPVYSENDNTNEANQRNFVYRALSICRDDDIIILSDIDEIPDPKFVRYYNIALGISSLNMKLYYYNMNCLSDQEWIDPKIGPWRDVKHVPPQDLRHVSKGWNGIKVIENAGWHFSHFGDSKALSKKIVASRHVELNTKEINNPDNISDAIRNGRDVYGRDSVHFTAVNVDDTYPKYVRDNIQHYKEIGYIKSETKTVKYSIVIPTYNHLDDYLKPCVESLKRTTDANATEVIIVANGCTDGTKQYVEGLGPQFRLIWHEGSLGFSKAINMGVNAAKGEYIILLNNDTVLLDPDWIDRLRKPFDVDPSVGITGPFLNVFTPTKHLWFAFFCNMISRKVFDKIGLLDEQFGVGSFEDIDFCIRAQLAGYKLVAASNDRIYEGDHEGRIDGEFPIFHVGGGTTTLLPNWNDITDKNYRIMLDKYKHLLSNSDIYIRYEQTCTTESDINEHLPVLRRYALECEHITEMGVREGNSTWALLSANPKKYVGYDIARFPQVSELELVSKRASIGFQFNHVDVLQTEIEPTDLLFIDTHHHYNQLSAELKLHGQKARKYLIFHDTFSFGERGDIGDGSHGPTEETLDVPGSGLKRAIQEFLAASPEWTIKEELLNNNGLMVLVRDQKKPSISIIIPTYNRLDDLLKPCLESIRNYTNLSDIEVIVCANGCVDGTEDYVKSLGEQFRLISMKERAGFVKPTNAGIKAARGEFIVLLNNDVQILPSERNKWLDILKGPFADPEVGLAGPEVCWIDNTNWRSVIFWCAMIRRSVFDKIGYLNEDFGEGQYEDVEFNAKAIKAGFKTARVPEDLPEQRKFTHSDETMPIYHVGTATYRHESGRDAMIVTNHQKLTKIIEAIKG